MRAVPLDDAIWGSNGPPPPIRSKAAPGAVQESTKPADKLELLWFDQIEPSLDANDFVQGLLTAQGACVVYGDSNAGKTFWTTDLALHVAAGRDWNGRRVEGGGVIYCALEGGVGFRNRVVAWRKANGLDDTFIPFAAIPSQLNLLDPEADTNRLIEAIERAAEQMRTPVKLVVIDTLSRAMAGGNENAPEDMGALVMNMDKIRQATKANCLFIHHSGKDAAKGARGHSLLRAAIDTEIEVSAEEGSDAKTATVVKQRELKKGDVFSFSLEIVELGANRHREPVTTCLVVHSDVSAGAAPRQTRLSGHPRRALEVLTNIIAAEGKGGFVGTPAGVLSIPDKWWRDRFYEQALPGAEYEAKKKAFSRASDKLIETHVVGMNNGRVWIVKSQPHQQHNPQNDCDPQ